MQFYETSHSKKFNVRLLITMVIFLILIAVQTFAFELYELNFVMKVVMAVIPVLPLFGSVYFYRQYYLTMDEYMRKITGEALIWVIALVGFGTFIYGMLSMKMPMPEFNLALLFPSICIAQGVIAQILLMVNDSEK